VDPLLSEVHRRLEAIPAAALGRLATAFAQGVATDGLHVVKEKDGAVVRVPIPPLLTPVLPDPDAAAAAKDLLHAIVLVSREMLEHPEKAPPGLFDGLSAFERRCIRSGWRDAERVASSRVDFLRAGDGRLLALEVNATIPAMQGYSDIVARGFVAHVGAALGAKSDSISRALAALPSNVDDLRRSLLAQAAESGAGKPGRWALLARANDSQDGELAWIAARWREAGLDPVRVTPEDFFEKGPFDLVYRHLFARRLEPGAPLEAVFAEPRRNAVWNPVNAHLELKAMLALAYEAAHGGKRVTLPPPIAASVTRFVPWTRLVSDAPAPLPHGGSGPLAAWVSAHPERIVLKRNFEYGGRGVFLAEDFADRETLARVIASVDPAITSWKDLVRFAAARPEGEWIAQERVVPAKQRHLRVVAGAPEWTDMTIDVSAFTGHGAAFAPSGLTARAATGPVVNIVSGGGMAPIIPREALSILLGRS
jgi:hypothetical protein